MVTQKKSPEKPQINAEKKAKQENKIIYILRFYSVNNEKAFFF